MNTTIKSIAKPAEGDYAPYTIAYIGLVPDDGQVLRHLEDNLQVMIDLVRGIPEDKLAWSFAEGEWTVKEILMHVIDSERIFGYRTLRIARNDTTPLPGFEQDDYVPYSYANERSLDDILDEYAAVRRATLTLLHSLHEDDLARVGTTSGFRTTVQALVYIITGHEMHHINSIRDNYASARG